MIRSWKFSGHERRSGTKCNGQSARTSSNPGRTEVAMWFGVISNGQSSLASSSSSSWSFFSSLSGRYPVNSFDNWSTESSRPTREPENQLNIALWRETFIFEDEHKALRLNSTVWCTSAETQILIGVGRFALERRYLAFLQTKNTREQQRERRSRTTCFHFSCFLTIGASTKHDGGEKVIRFLD